MQCVATAGPYVAAAAVGLKVMGVRARRRTTPVPSTPGTDETATPSVAER